MTADKNKMSAKGDQDNPPRRPAGSGLSTTFIGLLGLCCLITVSVNFLHNDTFVHHHPNMAIARAMADFKRQDFKERRQRRRMKKKQAEINEAEEIVEEGIIQEGLSENEDTDPEEDVGQPVKEEVLKVLSRPNELPPSKLGGLQCDKYGGPAQQDAQEMVYWSDIPSDAKYVSPLHAKRGQHRRYLTFEPDGGGWNNIRMAMETIVGLAIAMGRTLVLPPEQKMYLLRQGAKKQRTEFSFAHFFPMLEMAEENAGLEIMTMQEFLETEAMTGNLLHKVTKKPSFPPGNRTDWNGQDVSVLKEWLRQVTFYEHMWKPGQCLAAFPASGNHRDVEALRGLQDQIIKEGHDTKKYFGNPVAVDASPMDRMRENIASRSQLCVYDEEMQSKLVVHFMCYHKMKIRYLVHFYAFLYFEDWRSDLWMKRFMRDHMRYVDEIQCAAARIVHAVRERSRQRGWGGSFDTFHVRRGDFQFKTTRISAEEIHENSKDKLTPNRTIFIATDEKDKSFFNPMKEHYDIVFLDDYVDLLKDVNSNYFGMIDQLVASRGEVFFGCWFSTFTGFINRMRGYHSVKEKLAGSEDGVLPTTYYYATPQKKFEMHSYKPLTPGFFNREFPTSWRGIDKSIGFMPNHSVE